MAGKCSHADALGKPTVVAVIGEPETTETTSAGGWPRDALLDAHGCPSAEQKFQRVSNLLITCNWVRLRASGPLQTVAKRSRLQKAP